MDTSAAQPHSWLRTPLPDRITLKAETVAIIVLILLAVVTRFYDLGARVMSHDEVNHVVPAYDLYTGQGYRYDPLSHGPLQFHMMALSYFLFGDGDFSARIPAAAFSVATVLIAGFAFRRYLGRWGAFLAGVMCLISPYLLFYGRYTRNEAYIVVWGMLTIYAVLRYLERGERKILYLFTLVNAFHFVDKATSHIFGAAQLLFLAAYFVYQLNTREWTEPGQRRQFLLSLLGMGVAIVAAVGVRAITGADDPNRKVFFAIAGLVAVGATYAAVAAVLAGVGWQVVRKLRSFDLLIVIGTLILPLLSALPIQMLGTLTGNAFGGDPLDYSPEKLTGSVIVIAALGVIAIAVGLVWNREAWLKCAILFYAPFVLLYSTFFTNPVGLAGGFTGALGYWLQQQAVNRGSQPIYYYALVQVPVYEYLPALGMFLALIVAAVRGLWVSAPGRPFTRAQGAEGDLEPVPVAALLIFWSFAMLAAFSVAGEKMPWLTTHITMPLILAAGWGIGWLIESVDWTVVQEWDWRLALRGVALAVFALLGVLTARAAFRAAYINYDYAVEYVVYAHAARDPKAVFKQIEELSERTTGGPNMVVAYDNNVRYPYWWYMRHYPNRLDFDVNPTAEIKNAPVIVVSTENQAKVAPLVRTNYYGFNYMRMWWPNQDYWSIKWESIDGEYKRDMGIDPAVLPPMSFFEYLRRVWGHLSPYVTDPARRDAALEIWFNRDWSAYAALENTGGFTLTDWNPADKMTMYVRTDINNMIWNYGVAPEPVVLEDPYKNATVDVAADRSLGGPGTEPGQFLSPRGLAVARDGSLYVADAGNHRIQHFGPDGSLLNAWGSFADAAAGAAPGGTFNEPWDVAVAPDGNIYVADTWNHRVQVFSPDGTFISMWSQFGEADQAGAFYGPRGIAIDASGRIFVTDTGNKRVLVFDAQGKLLTQFGGQGLAPGQFDEPVGVAVDGSGNVYVADTWNQRVQVFAPEAGGTSYTPLRQWDINGWSGNSIENKPFISVDSAGRSYVTDPEACRVLQSGPDGVILHVWGACGGESGFGLFSGIAADLGNGVWVSDATSGRLVHFTPPSEP